MKYLRIFLVSISAMMIILKLTGEANWSWWIVLSPIWLTGSILAIVITLVIVSVYKDEGNPHDRFPCNY